MADVLCSLGGNIGDVRTTIAQAIEAVCVPPAVTLVARSSDYLTPPWGRTDQPPFINAAIAIKTELSPPALLDRAQSVERAFGRDRGREERWGPRTIDIDLLAYDDVELQDGRLTLPHPRLFERAFVLVPLAEIAPDRLIGGRRVADAAATLDQSGITRLPPLALTGAEPR